MKNLIIFLLAFLMSVPAFSQRDETILKNPRLRLTGLWGGSTNGINKFNDNTHFSHSGYFTFEFNKNFLIGWDGYRVSDFDESIGDYDIDASGLMLGYSYNGYQVVHPVAYVSLGRAKSRAEDLATVRSFTGQAGVGAEINVFRWFRIGGELGYRYVDDRGNDWIREAGLSSPYAGIKLKFGWSWGK